MTLQRLALSASALDRAAHRRADPALLGRLLADPETAVVVMSGDLAAVQASDDAPGLVLLSPHQALSAIGEPVLAVFLADDGSGRAHVLLAAAAGDDPPLAPVGARWAGLREVGALLDDTGAGLLTAAVALVNWHRVHPRCSRCGENTDVVAAGWARRCPACDAEHFPRTDPAVIMAVVDHDDRILLGRQASWPPRRFSTLAGFVEPGESLEASVRREVLEESGVIVGQVEYRGSQPWPFPSSLMLGFRAHATTTDVTVDGDELVQARWWTREQLAADVAGGEVLLSPRLSISRWLVEDWFGAALPDSAEAWR